MSEHSPTPWRADDLGPCDGWQIKDADGNCVVSDAGDMTDDDALHIATAANSHDQLVEAAQIGLRAAKLLVGLAGDECAFGSASVLWQKHTATIQAALSGTPTVPSRDQLVARALLATPKETPHGSTSSNLPAADDRPPLPDSTGA